MPRSANDCYFARCLVRERQGNLKWQFRRHRAQRRDTSDRLPGCGGTLSRAPAHCSGRVVGRAFRCVLRTAHAVPSVSFLGVGFPLAGAPARQAARRQAAQHETQVQRSDGVSGEHEPVARDQKVPSHWVQLRRFLTPVASLFMGHRRNGARWRPSDRGSTTTGRRTMSPRRRRDPGRCRQAIPRVCLGWAATRSPIG